MLSVSPQLPYFEDEAHAVEAARAINDLYAGLVRRYPTRFAAFADFEVLAEFLLLKNPVHESHPFFHPLFVLRVVHMILVHPFRGSEAVQRHPNIEKHFTGLHS